MGTRAGRRGVSQRCARSTGLLALVVIVLTGCDGHGQYQFVLENHYNQQVIVSLLGEQTPMRPCSVRTFSGPGPAFGRPVQIRVGDVTGGLLYSCQVKAGPRGSGNPFHVVIPGHEPVECPAPVTDRYELTVVNYQKEEVQVWLAGAKLGAIPPGATRRFPPLPGTWQDIDRIVVRNSSGKEASLSSWGIRLDYDLGQTPEATVYIAGYWF